MKAKVLLAHNYYDSSLPSGEATVLEAERALLEQHGHEVDEFFRYSDEILDQGVWGTLKGALSTPWNPFSAAAARKAVAETSADVIHVHNTFPLLSPAIFHSIGERAARVLTLHNYRLFCPAAIPLRDGNVCTDCLERHSILPALRHGCYRNSHIATMPIALSVALHRVMGTWIDEVDAFIALTDFQRDLMIEAGLPPERVHVKPNFYPGNPPVIPWSERRNSVVYAGRLTAEKGIEALVRAWLMWGESAPELLIIGDGGLRNELEQLAAINSSVPIRFLGQMSANATRKEITRCRLLVLPSECFEGFPMVLGEAFAFGTPVAVSNIGPLPSIVQQGQNGILFSAHNPESLLGAVRTSWETAGVLERLGAGARCAFEENYTDEVNYRMLIDIYQHAINTKRKRKSG